jgi:hypothetical protein
METATEIHLDACASGEFESCPDCMAGGIIQSETCATCGTARWVHRCGGRIWNPTAGVVTRGAGHVRLLPAAAGQ